jgi:hypothetical protein
MNATLLKTALEAAVPLHIIELKDVPLTEVFVRDMNAARAQDRNRRH